MTFEPRVVHTRLSHDNSLATRLSEPFTFSADNGIFMRFYPDCRPKNMEIAPLQKGLVLGFSGVELIEEGAGFGVPVAKFGDTAYFSSSAQLLILNEGTDGALVRKIYVLDAISRKEVRGTNINDGFYKFIHKNFEAAYLPRRRLLPVFDLTMRLRKILGVQTRFEIVEPKGKVVVTYICKPEGIGVHADFSELEKVNCREILMLNEQGAASFSTFLDSRGLVLHDFQIGPWAEINAEKATFIHNENSVSFSLQNSVAADLYRGRELIKDRFSWAGLTYALKPQTKRFDYTVSLNVSPRVLKRF